MATQVERRENITFNMTNDYSVSDISGISFVSASLKRSRQWTFQDWMTEEPVRIYYDKIMIRILCINFKSKLVVLGIRSIEKTGSVCLKDAQN